MLWQWIGAKVYAAVVGGFHKSFVALGVIESEATDPDEQAAAVRAAITTAPVAAVGDRPRNRRNG